METCKEIKKFIVNYLAAIPFILIRVPLMILSLLLFIIPGLIVSVLIYIIFFPDTISLSNLIHFDFHQLSSLESIIFVTIMILSAIFISTKTKWGEWMGNINTSSNDD